MKTIKGLIPAGKRIKAAVTMLIVILATGCTSVPFEKDVYPNDPDYAPVPSSSLQAAPNINGSLYKTNYSLSLFSDQQATQVGDIITVIFDEQYNEYRTGLEKLRARH
jgi:flagellar L-ring protein precursor FlgH